MSPPVPAGLLVLLAATLAAMAFAPAAGAVTLPPGFQARVLPIPRRSEAPAPNYINGLVRPTTLAFAPDGKMFVGDWFGRVKVFDSIDDSTPTLAVDISTDVHSYGDRGLLGMKLDPEFGTDGHNYIYLSYAYDQAMGSSEPPHAEYNDGGDNCENVSPYTDCVISGRVTRVELDPQTGVAVGGAVEPPQQVLVQSWCQQFNSHSMGDIEFDSSGALLVSGGEGANYSTADYGQFSNPCGDPENEGGSLRAQDVRTPYPHDRTDYSGSIIRINRETGEALPDNPLFKDPANPSQDNPDERARRILAYGFRNPFRFEVRPGTNEVYVGDVGQSTWEELDRVTSPPAAGQKALDFGWPCYEGGRSGNQVLSSWKSLAEVGHAPLCQELYEHPSEVTAPLWAYGHGSVNGHLFEGDECDPSPGAAFSGLAFYDPEGVAEEDLFPAEDRGALFMADAARGCIWVMEAGEGGVPDPTKIRNFATSDEASKISPVDIVQGPEGALYAPNFYGDSIEQFRYFPGNKAPEAALTASRVDGAMSPEDEFPVTFDAGASTDPDGDTLHYEWDLNGDGVFNDGSDEPTAHYTYTTPENVTVKVRVSDEYGHSDVASITLYPGDLGPPAPVIVEPGEALEWGVGDTIHYAGTATDPDGGTVGAGIKLHWDFSIRHCPEACHTHPLTSSDSPSGDLVAPPHDYPSHLRFELTATDARQRSVTVTRDIYPIVDELSLASEPAGVPLTLNGEPASEGPFRVIRGDTAAVAAPPTASLGGVTYSFASWSDGGAASHEVTAHGSTTLVARYAGPAGPQGPTGPTGLLVPPPIAAPRPAPPPAASDVRVRVGSRPPGVRLRIGGKSGMAPFAVELPAGVPVSLVAPRTARVHGHRLHFRRWLVGSRPLTGAAAKRVIPTAGARYVALYTRSTHAPPHRHG